MAKIKSPEQLMKHIIHNMRFGCYDENNKFIQQLEFEIVNNENYKYHNDPKEMESYSVYNHHTNIIYENSYFKEFLKRNMISEYEILYLSIDEITHRRNNHSLIIYFIDKSQEWVAFDPIDNNFQRVKMIDHVYSKEYYKDKLIDMMIHKFGKNLYPHCKVQIFKSDEFDKFIKFLNEGVDSQYIRGYNIQ